MIIPHQQLSSDALSALIEDYVTRDGTDYGVSEASIESKSRQIRRQLEQGNIVIVFDNVTETCNIIRKEDAPEFEREND